MRTAARALPLPQQPHLLTPEFSTPFRVLETVTFRGTDSLAPPLGFSYGSSTGPYLGKSKTSRSNINPPRSPMQASFTLPNVEVLSPAAQAMSNWKRGPEPLRNLKMRLCLVILDNIDNQIQKKMVWSNGLHKSVRPHAGPKGGLSGQWSVHFTVKNSWLSSGMSLWSWTCATRGNLPRSSQYEGCQLLIPVPWNRNCPAFRYQEKLSVLPIFVRNVPTKYTSSAFLGSATLQIVLNPWFFLQKVIGHPMHLTCLCAFYRIMFCHTLLYWLSVTLRIPWASLVETLRNVQ